MYQNKEFKFRFYLLDDPAKGLPEELINIENCRAMARISHYGNWNTGQTEIKIYGVSLDTIATITQRSTSFTNKQDQLNIVQIFYGDDLISEGAIIAAYADLNESPDSAIMMSVAPSANARVLPVKPFTYKGLISLKDCINAIAKTVNYTTEFYDVENAMLNNPYLVGDAISQMVQACSICEVGYALDFGKFVVMQAGLDSEPVLVSPTTGLIGYPVIQSNGVLIKAVYSPLFKIGQTINLETSLPHASGEYYISSIESNVYARTKGAVSQTLMSLVKPEMKR